MNHDDSVEAGIDRVKELISEGLEADLDDALQPGKAQVIEAEHRFSQTTESSFELQVTTRDGDRVNLKFSQLDQRQDVLAYRQSGSSEEFISNHITTSNSHFGLSVEGELDEDELSAITDLANNIQRLSEEFFTGNAQVAFEQGLQLGFDTEEIAGFALELQYAQSSK
jgi:hypothetical protein